MTASVAGAAVFDGAATAVVDRPRASRPRAQRRTRLMLRDARRGRACGCIGVVKLGLPTEQRPWRPTGNVGATARPQPSPACSGISALLTLYGVVERQRAGALEAGE